MSQQADRRHAAVVPIRPAPARPPSFADLGVSRQVAETLRMRGISEPFPIQTLVLRDALAGRDVLARSRTGSGKTLAFAVPIVERVTPSGGSPNALILAPTRELASQVTEEFRAIADVKRLKVKVSPIARWTQDDVDADVTEHGVLTNPLLTDGYASVGCAPCTRRVLEGEDARAGRWAGRAKTECGLHG